jgi:hypothetical protein
MSTQSDNHWWEFYGIRYAQGAVVGALIVYFLFSQNDVLKPLLFIPSESKDLGMAHLTLYAIYGLAYCYIASAPILILHAGRGLLYKSKTNQNPNKGAFWRRLCLIFLPLIISALFVYINNSVGNVNTFSDVTSIYIYSLLITFEVVILIEIFFTAWDKTISYNNSIIKKRSLAKNAIYVESYQHLREHGNSFFIVLLEFFLALPIYQFVSQTNQKTDSITNLFLIILFWIAPAALIWFFGNKLENNLQSM